MFILPYETSGWAPKDREGQVTIYTIFPAWPEIIYYVHEANICCYFSDDDDDHDPGGDSQDDCILI